MTVITMNEFAQILTKGLQPGNSNYLPKQMYIEFENVADPEDVVTAPEVDASETVSYFEDLSGSPSADYLRVTLSFMSPESTDEETYPEGNVMVMVSTPSDGGVTEGVHGKPFSSGANSKIYGGAIVAVVDPTDRSLDIQLCRFYLEAGEQFVFSSGSQKLIRVRMPILLS